MDISGKSRIPIEEIKPIIKDIEPNFDLIMITEYLHESLILLRYDLCLTLGKGSEVIVVNYQFLSDDVAFLSKNIARTKPRRLQDWVERKIIAWQRFDVTLYQHFNETFWKRVEHFGIERMDREVKLLRDHIKKLHHRCVDRKMPLQQLDQGCKRDGTVPSCLFF